MIDMTIKFTIDTSELAEDLYAENKDYIEAIGDIPDIVEGFLNDMFCNLRTYFENNLYSHDELDILADNLFDEVKNKVRGLFLMDVFDGDWKEKENN